MSWLNIGASVASSALGSLGSSSARRKQEEAAKRAREALQAGQQRNEILQQPYTNAGADAITQLMGRLPELTAAYDPARLTSEPGYEFGMREGQRALEGSLAARGLTDSGAALRAAARYGTDYSTTKLNDAFNRDRASRGDIFDMLTGVGRIGQSSAMNVGAGAMSTAGRIADTYIGAGNARAADSMGQGNIWGSLINQGASEYGRMTKDAAAPHVGSGWAGGTGWGTGDKFGNQDLGQFLADGGRVEPVIGTRAPRRKGGGGGAMTRDAVLHALDVAWNEAAPAGREPGTVATLPADPTRNPRAITDDRMRRAGAYADGGAVRSKTPGKADKVKANLSGGEHVIDAEVVAMLGDGNSEAGHALLDELKRRVREFKRSAPADQPAAAMRG